MHVTELQRLLIERVQADAQQVVEIRFDNPAARQVRPDYPVDEGFRNKVLSVDCPYGSVVIAFDEHNELRTQGDPRPR
jgi:hypothetical protein